MSDPLGELLEHLERRRPVPLAWVVEHAPDGDLRRAWEACGDADALLAVYTVTGDRVGLTRAACACARTVLHLVPGWDPSPRLAIEAAEAWCRGERTIAQVAAALREAVDTHWCPYDPRHVDGDRAGHYATEAAEIAVEMATQDVVQRLAQSVGAALYESGGAARDPGAVGQALAALAALVRAQLPCPALDQLLAAYRPR